MMARQTSIEELERETNAILSGAQLQITTGPSDAQTYQATVMQEELKTDDYSVAIRAANRVMPESQLYSHFISSEVNQVGRP